MLHWFLPRWQRYESLLGYEGLLGGNFKPLSRSERGNLRYLVDHPEALVWRSGLTLPRQRGLTHPNRVVEGYKAANREKNPDANPKKADLQQRVFVEQDEKLEAHRKIIADLRAKLDDHEWNYDDEVVELLLTLVAKIRNHSIREQVSALAVLLRALGWSNEVFEAMGRLIRSAPKTGKGRP